MTKSKHLRGSKYIITGSIIVGLLLLVMIFVNNTFFEHYYQTKKQNAMVSAYDAINAAYNDGRNESEEFEQFFRSICEKNNLNIIVIDYESQTLIASDADYELLNGKLLGYIFSRAHNLSDELLEQTEQYELHLVTDERTHIEYIDMWGVFDSGNLFLIRAPMEGIRESIRISKTFFNYVVISLAFVAMIAIFLYYRKVTITQLEEANERLRLDIRQKEETDAMRTEFLSSVSHELKTPIALIQGYAEGLRESINDAPDEREYYCDVIVDEAAKMNTIVKKLLDLSRLEYGEETLSAERFDFVELVKNYLQSVDVLCKPKNVRLSFEGEDALYVVSDEYAVGEILNNYFTNAINHVKEDGRIDVRLTRDGTDARLSVFNEGTPVPEESIPYLWDKFYKVDKARTREYGGSGVGLSIVKALSEALHGTCGVRNYDDGVMFYFTLPVEAHSSVDDGE